MFQAVTQGTHFMIRCCPKISLNVLFTRYQHLPFEIKCEAKRSFSFFEELRDAIRTILTNNDHSNPKNRLERHYLCKALLLTHWRDSRIRCHVKYNDKKMPQKRLSGELGTSNNENLSDEIAETLYDEVVDELDKKHKIDKRTNVQLRSLLQAQFQPQVQQIFEAFHNVDNNLHVTSMVQSSLDTDCNHGSSGSATKLLPTKVSQLIRVHENLYKEILFEDYDRTRVELDQTVNRGSIPTQNTTQPQLAFLARKLAAIETLLEFHQWFPSQLSKKTVTDDHKLLSSVHWNKELDAFGMQISSIAESSIAQMRYYQTFNLCRSARIKEQLGYSVLTLQSSIPDAGRGTYVDGGDGKNHHNGETKRCYAGTVIAFQPGEVWPKEHLITESPELIQHFQHDPDCHVSIRFDEYVIDSRQSPVTILAREPAVGSFNNNPWALGHMINHPPSCQMPNALSCMLNYCSAENNKLDDARMQLYIPNQYSHKPGWTHKLIEDDILTNNTFMHGLCLITATDVCNQELMYDYKLQQGPEHYPSWFKPVKYPDDTFFGKRTNNENKEEDDSSFVFFRDDWKNKK